MEHVIEARLSPSLSGIPGSKGHEDLGGFTVLERDKLQILSEDDDPRP